MNYQKIYQDFIASRRLREADIVGYSEKHHIVPKALGGGNEKANLIRLTPEDHFFAHCCLAKAHGREMWSALWLMSRTQKTQHGAAAFCMGRLIKISREQAAGQRSKNMKELWGEGLFTRNRVYSPISESHREAVRKASTGRIASPETIAKRCASRTAASPTFTFTRSIDGLEFFGTANAFSKKFSIGQSLISCLTRGKILCAKGWVLDTKVIPSTYGRSSVVRIFKNKDGSVFRGTQYDFRTRFSLDTGVLTNLIKGKNGVKSFKGWVYVGDA